MSGVEVRDSGDLRKYRTEIPNIVLEMGLSPYALALYVHLKRTAGQEGACWKSTRTLAGETGISAAKVCDARKELEARSLIVVDRPEVNGSRQTVYVTITDMWPENFQHFSERSMERSTERSPHERSVHTTNAERSPHERRKEPLRKEPKKNPTGGKETLKPVAIENRTQSQTLTDDFYRCLQDKHKVRLEKEQYGFHLGSFRNMLEKDEPTTEEIERVLAHMVEVFPTAPKIRATKALQDVRLKRDTGEAWQGPAPWEVKNEPLNPASDEAIAKRDKPNAPTWYATFYSVSISVAESMLKEHDTHSAMLDALERRNSASA